MSIAKLPSAMNQHKTPLDTRPHVSLTESSITSDERTAAFAILMLNKKKTPSASYKEVVTQATVLSEPTSITSAVAIPILQQSNQDQPKGWVGGKSKKLVQFAEECLKKNGLINRNVAQEQFPDKSLGAIKAAYHRNKLKAQGLTRSLNKRPIYIRKGGWTPEETQLLKATVESNSRDHRARNQKIVESAKEYWTWIAQQTGLKKTGTQCHNRWKTINRDKTPSEDPSQSHTSSLSGAPMPAKALDESLTAGTTANAILTLDPLSSSSIEPTTALQATPPIAISSKTQTPISKKPIRFQRGGWSEEIDKIGQMAQEYLSKNQRINWKKIQQDKFPHKSIDALKSAHTRSKLRAKGLVRSLNKRVTYCREGGWTSKETDILTATVNSNPRYSFESREAYWTRIAQTTKLKRTAQQCVYRWTTIHRKDYVPNHSISSKKFTHTRFSSADDNKLIAAIFTCGMNWNQIHSLHFPNAHLKCLKARWRTVLRPRVQLNNKLLASMRVPTATIALPSLSQVDLSSTACEKP